MPRWVENKTRVTDFAGNHLCSPDLCFLVRWLLTRPYVVYTEVGHVASVIASIMQTLDAATLQLATRPSFSEMLGELETVLEELLRAMSTEQAAIAAHDLSEIVRSGHSDHEFNSSPLEDIGSLLAMLDEFQRVHGVPDS